MWVMTSASAVVFGAPLPCPSPRGIYAFGQTWTLPAGGGDGRGGLAVPRLKPWPATRRRPGCSRPHGACPRCSRPHGAARGVPVHTAPPGVFPSTRRLPEVFPSTRRLPEVFPSTRRRPGCSRPHGACPGCSRPHGDCPGCFRSAGLSSPAPGCPHGPAGTERPDSYAPPRRLCPAEIAPRLPGLVRLVRIAAVLTRALLMWTLRC